jgi:hypothetical protein
MVTINRRIGLKGYSFILVLFTLVIFSAARAQEAWEDGKQPPDQAIATLAPTATPAPPTATPAPQQVVEQFPGGDITIEERLRPGANYNRYIVSYPSDGNKIYALMTVPWGDRPVSGWPVLLLNHGYIPPAKYVTTGSYVAHVDALARHGYIIFKSDYRGHGKSEGGFGRSRSGYVQDVLSAVDLLKRHPYADANRIGMWGHSMGGYITMAIMLSTTDIKAGVIWAGSVRIFGSSSAVKGMSGPVQLHHATGDAIVPFRLSTELTDALREAGEEVEFYPYQGDNHDIAGNATTALTRSLYFFEKYVKNAPSAGDVAQQSGGSAAGG